MIFIVICCFLGIKKTASRILFLFFWCSLAISAALAQPDPLPSWTAGEAKQSIVKFVSAVTESGGRDYVPPSERIAVFDNDGTLWSERPASVETRFILDQIQAHRPRLIKAKSRSWLLAALRNDVDSILEAGELAFVELTMATHVDRTTDEFDKVVKDWLATAKHPHFRRPYTDCTYQPMMELMNYLRANGFKTYIVSGGGADFVRCFSESIYGVPPEQVIGTVIKLRFALRDRKPVLVRMPKVNFVDNKAGKPVAIFEHTGRRPIAAFGNSDGDLEMLQWVTSGPGARFGLLVHHDDADREFAYDRISRIGKLDKALDEAKTRGWTVISMKNDWNNVFSFSPPY